MPEIPNRVPSETITVEWANTIRDRVLQRYTDKAERTSLSSSPGDGELSFLEDSGEISYFYNSSWRRLLPVGVVLPYAGGAAPNGFLICNGAAVSRTTYEDLFGVVGTTFGAGDGSTTFNLPDMRQRFPLGVAASGTGNARGATGGAIDHTHLGGSHTHGFGTQSTDTQGAHTHAGPSHTHAGPSHTHSFSDSFTTSLPSTGKVVRSETFDTAAAVGHTHTGSVSGTTGSGGTGSTGASGTGSTTAGGDHAHTITVPTVAANQATTGGSNPPFLALHFIIRT